MAHFPLQNTRMLDPERKDDLAGVEKTTTYSATCSQCEANISGVISAAEVIAEANDLGYRRYETDTEIGWACPNCLAQMARGDL